LVDNELSPHVDDVLNALSAVDKEISREEIEKELIRFIEYGVPIDQAKQTLIKKFGGVAVFSTGKSSERKLISDLQPNQRNVNLLCKLITVNPKETTIKGEKRKIFYGILGDESGTAPFTAWCSVFDFEKGDVLEIVNAYTRSWQNGVQLNFGEQTRIIKTDKEKLPESALKPKEIKVKDLRSGIGAVDLTVKIIELNTKDAEVNGLTKKVFSGIIADETGKAQFTSWHDFKLKESDVIRITGGYVKSWKGIPQLTFDEKAIVKKLDKNKISKKDLQVSKMPIFALVEKRGAIDVEVKGTILEIRPGSGIIMRCPQCNRTIKNNECIVHKKVDGKIDLRLKLVVDDGTGSVSSVLNKELTEKILGKTLEECKNIDENEFLNQLNKALFTKRISLKGNALADEFGTNIIAKDAKLVDVDINEEAEKLFKELEELL
jgi:replication factor A1